MENLKPLVNNKTLYDSFLDYLKGEITRVQTFLENTTDPIKMYQYQGEIRRMRRLMQLREEVNGPPKESK